MRYEYSNIKRFIGAKAMGKRYSAKIKKEYYGGLETVFVGQYCSDGKFHFYSDYRLGFNLSPYDSWIRFLDKTNAQIIDSESNEISVEEFVHQISKVGISKKYLINGAH